MNSTRPSECRGAMRELLSVWLERAPAPPPSDGAVREDRLWTAKPFMFQYVAVALVTLPGTGWYVPMDPIAGARARFSALPLPNPVWE